MDDVTIDNELYRIVCQGDPFNELNTRLKSLPNVDQILDHLYERDDQQVNLLMLAAIYGHDEVIRVILSHSSDVNGLVEISGNVIDINGNFVENVTALWCACDRGHFTAARTLIEIGEASVYHSSRHPLIVDAIINGRLDIIQFLFENNYVDINGSKERSRRSHNSLMLSASRGQTKIVAYLLEKGADVDFTSRSNETALGCAAAEGHLDIVQLLCSAGASTNIKARNGETPLILAFQNGHSHVVDYLVDLTKNELCIEELEIIACSSVVKLKNINNAQSQFIKMINLIQKIFHLRKTRNVSKIIAKPIAAYNFQQECQTIEEFEKIQHDNHRLYIEGLLIQERILFPKKTITLCEPLLIYGQNLVEQNCFEHCLHLWEHAFHLYQNMGHETSLHRFVWIFCKMIMANIFISSQLFVKICRLTFEPSEQHKKNHSIKNALCLLTIAAKVLQQPTLTKTERQSIYQWISDICRQQRITTDGQTLLHLSVNEQTYRDINYRANEIKQVLNFPNLAATQLLLTYGNRWINIDAIDISNGNTPLHIVSQSTKPDALQIVEYLINAGAHVDCLNKHNKTPLDYAETTEMKSILQKYQIPSLLKCLCARFIVSQQLNYEFIWPVETKLNAFIYLHGCIEKENRND